MANLQLLSFKSRFSSLRSTSRHLIYWLLASVAAFNSPGGIHSLSLSPDGQQVVYAGNEEGTWHLYLAGRPEPLPGTTNYQDGGQFAVANKSGRLAYTTRNVTQNVQRLALDPTSGSITGTATCVTTGTRQWSDAQPSPDGGTLGEWLAGDLDSLHPKGIALYSVSRHELVKLTNTGCCAVWLSDSQRLVFKEDHELVLISLRDRRRHEVLSVAPDDIVSFALSRDDRTMFLIRRHVESDVRVLDLAR